MQNITIWHNPRCSKSRASLELLESKGLDIHIIEYLKTTPNESEITEALQMLGMPARSLMRTKEKLYQELGLEKENNEEILIKAMVENPILIERPLVIKDGTAAIGRPIEKVIDLIS